jgi:hypothetical protein
MLMMLAIISQILSIITWEQQLNLPFVEVIKSIDPYTNWRVHLEIRMVFLNGLLNPVGMSRTAYSFLMGKSRVSPINGE